MRSTFQYRLRPRRERVAHLYPEWTPEQMKLRTSTPATLAFLVGRWLDNDEFEAVEEKEGA